MADGLGSVAEFPLPADLGLVAGGSRDFDLNNEHQIIPVRKCEKEEFQGKTREKTRLVAVLLSMRYFSPGSVGRRQIALSSSARYGSRGNARQRTDPGATTARTYDRLCIFADASAAQKCFAVILRSQQESFSFFQFCMENSEGVGHLFALEEPEPITHSLGTTSSVPILIGCRDVIPLRMNPYKVVPICSMMPPPAGETHWFCMHKVYVEFSNVKIGKAKCNGQFCDRQQVLDDEKCGCFHTERIHDLVFTMDVTIPNPTGSTQKSMIVSKFSSLHTSNLFVRNSDVWDVLKDQNSSHDIWKSLELLRKSVDDVNEYICQQSAKWTVIGWVRTGIVRDASDTHSREAEDLASQSQIPHISYLFPTHYDILQTELGMALRDLQLTLQPDGQTLSAGKPN